ncbi:hypothetical protein Aperf_G00000085843 [Anoplocephala perfoliata]
MLFTAHKTESPYRGVYTPRLVRCLPSNRPSWWLSLRFGIMLRVTEIVHHSLLKYVQKKNFHVCLVGSGPSAFYVAQSLLKRNENVRIDMLEKLPVPFGLVRYGVAPDHPEIKNIINTFTQVAKNPRFNYYGNITVGKDLKLMEIRSAYDAVVLAYGASADKYMNIPGEELPGVLSAKDFVGWYNGYPKPDSILPDLNNEHVAIVGMGNVALDVARIMLSPIDRLRRTDIPEPVIAHLATSQIRHVTIIGRRGPLQTAFMLKEFRELCRLPEIKLNKKEGLRVEFTPADVFDETLLTGCQRSSLLNGLPRARRRLIDFILQKATEFATQIDYGMCRDLLICEFRFLRSPIRVVPRNFDRTDPKVSNVAGIDLQANKLIGPPNENQKCVARADVPLERLECGLVVRSIGQRSVQIDPDLPFDEERGVIACSDELGRVPLPACLQGIDDGGAQLYASGWAKVGAVGVILNTLTDARVTAEVILNDLAARRPSPDHVGFVRLKNIVEGRGGRPVSFEGWERVDATEKAIGLEFGKPREKFTSLKEILQIAFAEVARSRFSLCTRPPPSYCPMALELLVDEYASEMNSLTTYFNCILEQISWMSFLCEKLRKWLLGQSSLNPQSKKLGKVY